MFAMIRDPRVFVFMNGFAAAVCGFVLGLHFAETASTGQGWDKIAIWTFIFLTILFLFWKRVIRLPR